MRSTNRDPVRSKLRVPRQFSEKGLAGQPRNLKGDGGHQKKSRVHM